jgi:ADP-ribose pyrophosphatase
MDRHYTFDRCKFARVRAHGGEREISFARVHERAGGPLRFIDFSVLAPGADIGCHTHTDDNEELYVIVEGRGLMSLDGEEFEVQPGDVILNRAGGSHGVVVRRRDEFLLIRQYRFIVGEHVWAIPSGGVEPGEDPALAAAREMEEETGYRAHAPLRHLFGYYPSYGCGNQRFELFLADDPVQVREAPDPQEVMSTRWFAKHEVAAMIARNEIVDGLSLTPLLAVLLKDAGLLAK